MRDEWQPVRAKCEWRMAPSSCGWSCSIDTNNRHCYCQRPQLTGGHSHLAPSSLQRPLFMPGRGGQQARRREQELGPLPVRFGSTPDHHRRQSLAPPLLQAHVSSKYRIHYLGRRIYFFNSYSRTAYSQNMPWEHSCTPSWHWRPRRLGGQAQNHSLMVSSRTQSPWGGVV